MKYAVIRSGGKQYKVSEGQTIEVEKIKTSSNKASDKNLSIEFDQVLLTVDDGNLKIGQPLVDVKVKAKVLEDKKAKKIDVFKYKAKSGYRRKLGHRQHLTKVLIEKIGS
ncbi:MAG: 50S ribosomal protein L21 [Candidatus Woykebacteria bacterium]